MRPKVLVTHWLQPEAEQFLHSFAEVLMPTQAEGVFPAERIRKGDADVQALLVCMADRVDAELLDAFPRLRIVAAAVKGGNNIDVPECSRRGIWVTLCPDLLTAPTAELTVGMMIALGRRLNEAQTTLRGGFTGWRPQLLATGLAGRTAGLIGMGRLGHAVARRLQGFEMDIAYHDPDRRAENLPFARLPLDELLARSDYVVLLAPLTPETESMIHTERLTCMRPGAMLINCARGSLVDEVAIARALASGHLGGYAADVFAMEDLNRPDHPAAIHPELLALGNKVLLTPHIGSAVTEFRRLISLSTAEQIKVVFDGCAPPLAINSIRNEGQE